MGRRDGTQGSTLVEVLAATALLLLFLAPLGSLFATSRFTALDSGLRARAVNVARTWLERFLGMDWPRMEAYLADPANGFTALAGGTGWQRDYAPDPDDPRFDVRVAVTERRLRAQLTGDAIPEQLAVRDITVTVLWRLKDAEFTVQQATTMHRR